MPSLRSLTRRRAAVPRRLLDRDWGTLAPVLLVLALLLSPFAAAQEPPLPPGLAPPSEPALPPGLEGPSEPALPPGLAPPSEPALPPGLGGAPAPALPPGLEGAPGTVEAPEAERSGPKWPFPLHGFVDTRAGVRLDHDEAVPRDFILGETRLQLETGHAWNRLSLDFTGDVLLDGVMEEADFDLRRLRLTWTPLPNVDLRAGRQVLTWGTGDLLFINDLFPKDYVSFLIGRDQEYLKAPSDSLRVGWYNAWMNVELVYTPQFTPDIFITGERISYYQPFLRRRAGRDNPVTWNAPTQWFDNDEIALRLYRTLGKYEVALYAYDGYWKSPGGQTLLPPRAVFPRLSVYGASLRGPVGRGIANVEVGYYDSRDDRRGRDWLVNNSEFRLLLGYEQEIGRELTASVQYYLEHMMDYGGYRRQPRFLPRRDQDRHLFTLRLTKLLMNQNLTVSFFTFYSPSDGDAYFRPHVSYKLSDAWRVEGGANIFVGRADSTFFGQLEENSNVYAGVRWSF